MPAPLLPPAYQVSLQLLFLLLGYAAQLVTVLPFTCCRRVARYWRVVGYLTAWGGILLVRALIYL